MQLKAPDRPALRSEGDAAHVRANETDEREPVSEIPGTPADSHPQEHRRAIPPCQTGEGGGSSAPPDLDRKAELPSVAARYQQSGAAWPFAGHSELVNVRRLGEAGPMERPMYRSSRKRTRRQHLWREHRGTLRRRCGVAAARGAHGQHREREQARQELDGAHHLEHCSV